MEKESQPAGQALDCLPKQARDDHVHQWARSKHNGRPHPTDTWELKLKKGEQLKVLQNMGNDWFIVQNASGHQGYAHNSWFDLEIPREAYGQWLNDVKGLMEAGAIRSLPSLARYMNGMTMCHKDVCQKNKKMGLVDVCAHDLKELLVGSGEYSLEKLKTQRNMWHPDRFARFCHPDHRAALSSKAEALFVMFGVLMDELTRST